MVPFFCRRSVEVTFVEVGGHLGVETQRQWSDLATARTTPCPLALFPLVTLWASTLAARGFVQPGAPHSMPRPKSPSPTRSQPFDANYGPNSVSTRRRAAVT